jgi:acyl-coenzyme A thioesterase PaaI-like protein
MPVSSDILNPFGTVQAGAMIWLADVPASVLAIEGQTIGQDGKGFPLAIDIHTTLVSNQRDGDIRAEARFVYSVNPANGGAFSQKPKTSFLVYSSQVFFIF